MPASAALGAVMAVDRKMPGIAAPSLQAHRADPLDTDMDPRRALVGFGFRCWMRGFETGDISSWEMCWNQFASTIGPKGAKRAVADLSCWVKTMRSAAGRMLQVFPTHCPGFCRDECLAISMIAAGQNDVCPAMRACAYALLETNQLDQSVETGLTFAATLRDEGIILASQDVVNAAALMGAETFDASGGAHLKH